MKSSSFYTPPAEGPWTWKWTALAYSIPTVSVLYPGPPAQGSQQPRSEFCVDVWGHLGSPSSPWVICKEPFGIKQNGWQSYLREVIRQLMTALYLDLHITSTKKLVSRERVGQSAVQQISSSTFKCRHYCRGKSITIYCFKKEDVSQTLILNIRHYVRKRIQLQLSA